MAQPASVGTSQNDSEGSVPVRDCSSWETDVVKNVKWKIICGSATRDAEEGNNGPLEDWRHCDDLAAGAFKHCVAGFFFKARK